MWTRQKKCICTVGEGELVASDVVTQTRKKTTLYCTKVVANYRTTVSIILLAN